MANYIILDAGHSKITAGKRSPDSSLLEWEFNNDMQYRLKARLEQLGFIVYLVNPTPGKGSEVSLAKRCQLANNYWVSKGKPSCLFISLHANAAGNGGWSTARGVEVFTAKNASAKSQQAAKKIVSSIFTSVYAFDKGFKNRGHKVYNYYVVKNTSMPSCLIEYEFYSNQAGVALLKNRRSELCEATLKGICEYFSVPYRHGLMVSQAQVQVIEEPVDKSGVPSTRRPWKNGTYKVKARISANILNVRAGRPGDPNYNNIMGTLRKGDIVEIGYCLNGWFGIIYNGRQAFISGDYIELV